MPAPSSRHALHGPGGIHAAARGGVRTDCHDARTKGYQARYEPRWATDRNSPAPSSPIGSLKARPIRRAMPAELRTRNFPAGSMGPKIEAVCRCVEATGSWSPSVGWATPSTAHWPSRDPHRPGSWGSPTRYQSATPCWLGLRRGVDVAFGVASADLNATSFNTGMGVAVNRGLSLAARNEIPARTHPVALGRTRWRCAPLETHGG